MVEIERKFLVKSLDYKKTSTSKERIVQGFLNTHEERTVRVRIYGALGFLTIKGKSNTTGTLRFEWETEITVEAASRLLELCEKNSIEKTRSIIPNGKHIFEVDEFHGDNEGLIIAEIELQDENEKFIKPDWLGEEVTGDIRYYNSRLSKEPYKNWKKR